MLGRRTPAREELAIQSVQTSAAAAGDAAQQVHEDERRANQAAAAAAVVTRAVDTERQVERRAISEAQAKLRRAQDVLDKAELWQGVFYLYDEVKHWPSWSRRDDWAAPLVLDELAGGSEDGLEPRASTRWVAWRRDGRTFRLQLVDRGTSSWSDDMDRHGELSVQVDDVQVLAISCAQDLSSEWSTWRGVTLNAFTAGPWMIDLARLIAEVRGVKEAESRKRDLAYYGGRADRIILDE